MLTGDHVVIYSEQKAERNRPEKMLTETSVVTA